MIFRRTASRIVPILAAALLAGALPAAALAQGAAPPAAAAPREEGARDFSRAERLLFMTEHLDKVKPPTTLRYSFRRSGALEPPFEDKVAIVLTKEADGSCCHAKGEFLQGERKLKLPEIDNARANPVLLYFLEHDVRDMKRITKGASSYYRKRIRMALYQAATVTDVTLDWRGRPVKAQRVDISPYDDDPARSRFEKYARKSYQFWLAEAVPGGVYGMRSVMRDEAAGAPPMVVEELFIEGATAPQRN